MENKIIVRGENYTVEPIDIGSGIQYQISTDCNYIMTVRKDEHGNWSANPDVQVMDQDLVDDIGSAIEMYNAGRQ